MKKTAKVYEQPVLKVRAMEPAGLMAASDTIPTNSDSVDPSQGQGKQSIEIWHMFEDEED